MPIVLERRGERSIIMTIASPAIAILVSAITMAAIFVALGYNPISAIKAYFVSPLTDIYTAQEIAVKATPLVLIATGLCFCYRANVWNIGAEGQFLMGAISGSWLALNMHGSDGGSWLMPAMLALGALGGATFALLPAVFKNRYGASEVLTSLMLVYISQLLLDYLVRGPFRDPGAFNFPTTVEFDRGAVLPPLGQTGRVHLGVILTLIVVGAASLFLNRTICGFSIRVTGEAPRAARFGGFDSKRLTILTFVISGGLAGFAGIVEVAGTVGHLHPNISPGYGFSAIIVAFLGRLSPIGVVFAALFLAITIIGAEGAQVTQRIPLDLTKVFQGILLLYILAFDSLVIYRIRWLPT
jgi:general nucleoside transport system permease protein